MEFEDEADVDDDMAKIFLNFITLAGFVFLAWAVFVEGKPTFVQEKLLKLSCQFSCCGLLRQTLNRFSVG